jgi:hypothetical protein
MGLMGERGSEAFSQAGTDYRMLKATTDRSNVGLTVERRLGGAGMRITPAERREISLAYLSEPGLGTISACAKHFSRTREAIKGCLKGDDFEALRRQVDHEMGESATVILKRAVGQAATAWVGAVDVAAEKGDHKPARDLLIATNVIEPPQDGPKVIVQIGVRDGDVQYLAARPLSTSPAGGGQITE